MQAANCFAGAASSEIYPKRDHLKLYKACMTEPESAARPSFAVTGGVSAEFRDKDAIFLPLFLITSYNSAAQLYPEQAC